MIDCQHRGTDFNRRCLTCKRDFGNHFPNNRDCAWFAPVNRGQSIRVYDVKKQETKGVAR